MPNPLGIFIEDIPLGIFKSLVSLQLVVAWLSNNISIGDVESIIAIWWLETSTWYVVSSVVVGAVVAVVITL